MNRVAFAGMASVVCLSTTCARGDIIVSFTEVSNTIQLRVTGSLQTTSFGLVQTTVQLTQPTIVPATGRVQFGQFVSLVDLYSLESPFTVALGSGEAFTGQTPPLSVTTSFGMAGNQIWFPSGYVSGSEIDLSIAFTGTFASRGLAVSPVVYTLPGNQTISLVFIVVPAPGVACSAAGLTLLAARRRRALIHASS
jgi:hypothetical protein